MKPIGRASKLRRGFFGSIATLGVVAAIGLGTSRVGAQNSRPAEHWVGTWATAAVSSQEPVVTPRLLRQPPPASQAATSTGTTAPAAPRPQPQPPIQAVSNQTLRQIVHTTIGGSRVRVVFTNAFGTAPVTIGAAHVALREKDAAIVATSGKPLTFSGKPSVTIPAGAVTLSDPADLALPPFSDLAIDLYVPGDTAGMPLTMHTGALQTNYLSEPGNHAGTPAIPIARTVTSWYFLGRIEVVASESVGAVVTFGDSITDGTASTPNTNHRWPDDLARRLGTAAANGMGVLNLGIGGNRLLSNGRGVNALARFDRDVAAQAGITYMILLEGINDIGFAADDPSPTPADLIAAHQQLIARAHARGLKIIGATVTPFEGAAYQTAVGESKRQEFNKWIRSSGAYDGVIDFEAAVRDPRQPTRGLAAYDPGDHLHFNDVGYQTMADSVDLSFFKLTGDKTSGSR